jgi:hypothetical protein
MTRFPLKTILAVPALMTTLLCSTPMAQAQETNAAPLPSVGLKQAPILLPQSNIADSTFLAMHFVVTFR